MEIIYTIPPYAGTASVVTLNEAKKQLRIEHDYEDEEIQGFIDSAVAEAESYIGSILLEREVTFSIAGWVDRFNFPLGPVNGVTSVGVVKEGVPGVYEPLNAASYKFYNFSNGKYQLIFRKEALALKLEPDTLDAIKITSSLGWSKANLPKDIIKAVKLILTDAYEFRGEKDLKLNRSSRNLLRPYKHWA